MRTHCCNSSDLCNEVHTDEVSCDSQLDSTKCRSTAVPFTRNITMKVAGLHSAVFDCASDTVQDVFRR